MFFAWIIKSLMYWVFVKRIKKNRFFEIFYKKQKKQKKNRFP